MTRRRMLYVAARIGMLAAALACVLLGIRQSVAALRPADAIALTVLLIAYVALLRMPVPLHVSTRRRRIASPRIPFELPLVAVVLAHYGGILCATLVITAHLCAFSYEQRTRIVGRVLDGGTEAAFWLVVALALPGTTRGFFWFVLIFASAAYLYQMLVWTPLVTLRDRVELARMWRRSAVDVRLWAAYAGGAAWGFFFNVLAVRESPLFSLAALAPLVALAGALRALQKSTQELHRLRLARDAVQALLRARDPVPQMNSLLASIYRSDVRETLQIYSARGSSRERLSPLASIGPALDDDQMELTRQVLVEVQHTERRDLTYRTRDYVVVAHPVRSAQDELLGALLAHRSARSNAAVRPRRFEATARELAPLLSDLRSIAQTQTAATVDPLTGLANRRTIMQCLREEIEEVRVGAPCAVLVMDLDRFKSINDTLGHQAGDHCLRVVGGVIARNIRSVDRAGRIGGEEFVVLMPETTRETAFTVAERLRKAVASSGLRYAGGEPMTASIGVTIADIGDSVDSLLARADGALYDAKRQGRNRVIETNA